MKAIGSMIHSACAGSPAARSKALIFYILYFIFSSAGLYAQTNVLHIGEVTYPAGRTATIPVELENQSDIVGVQFEIVTPYALKAFEVIDLSQPLVLLNSQRADDHEVSVTLRTGYHSYSSAIESYYKRYRVMVYSPTNTKLNGSSGTLLTLQFDLPEGCELVESSVMVGSFLLGGAQCAPLRNMWRTLCAATLFCFLLSRRRRTA